MPHRKYGIEEQHEWQHGTHTNTPECWPNGNKGKATSSPDTAFLSPSSSSLFQTRTLGIIFLVRFLCMWLFCHQTGSHILSLGAGIKEADDSQVTTVFTVQPPFHHRHSTNRVSWSVTIVGERRGEVWLHVRRWWKRFMILGLSSADGGMTFGLWKLSSLDGRRPPWYRPQV